MFDCILFLSDSISKILLIIYIIKWQVYILWIMLRIIKFTHWIYMFSYWLPKVKRRKSRESHARMKHTERLQHDKPLSLMLYSIFHIFESHILSRLLKNHDRTKKKKKLVTYSEINWAIILLNFISSIQLYAPIPLHIFSTLTKIC